jgi:histidinol-phosphate aminotransferase
LSALTQAAAEVAIDHAPGLQSGLKSLISERTRVSEALVKLGWKCEPSQANFLLFSEFPDEPANVWQKFLERGVLIRDVGLEIDGKKYLRVTIGTPEENNSFLRAAHEIADAG